MSSTEVPADQLSTEVPADQLLTEVPSLNERVKALQKEIDSAHYAYCNEAEISSLCSQDMVCHLYQDGEITMQKGDKLYGRRNEHIDGFNFGILNIPKFVLPLTLTDTIHTYAILTYSECIKFRQKMESLAV